MATPADVIDPITIDAYSYDAWESALNHSPELYWVTEKGNFMQKEGGQNVTMPIEAGEFEVHSFGEDEDVTASYTPTKLHAQATLGWAQKSVLLRMSRTAMMRNRGDREALVQWRDRAIPKAMRNLCSQGSGSIGYALLNQVTTDSQRTYGLGDIFRFDNVTTSDKEATVTSAATYAGLSLEVDGITSVDNADSYAWTPRSRNVDYDWDADSSADGALDTANFPLIFSELQTDLTFGNDPSMQPSCVIHDKTHFNVGRAYVASLQQIYIQRPDKGDKKWGVGNDSKEFYHNGLWHCWSSNMPASTSYMLNFDQIFFFYLRPMPLSEMKWPGKTSGDIKDEDRKSWFTFEVDYTGSRRGLIGEITADYQAMIHPRYQGIVKKFTA